MNTCNASETRSPESAALESLRSSPHDHEWRARLVYRELRDHRTAITWPEYRRCLRIVIPVGVQGAVCVVEYPWTPRVFEVEAFCKAGDLSGLLRPLGRLLPPAAFAMGADSLYADTETTPTEFYRYLGWEPAGDHGWEMTRELWHRRC